jgi:hypothetical protein
MIPGSAHSTTLPESLSGETSVSGFDKLDCGALTLKVENLGGGQGKRQLNALSVISPTMTVPVDQALLPVGRAGPAFASI